jgi:hypothetical protein
MQIDKPIQDIDTRRLAQGIVDEMKLHGHALWIDPEIHAMQHEFIAQLVKEREDKVERRKRMEERIAGSLVLSALLGVITLLGVGVLSWVRNQL